MQVKSKVEILQNFVAFSEYVNFIIAVFASSLMQQQFYEVLIFDEWNVNLNVV